ncbi:MAG: arginine repressor [Planctomycetota bacterium]
MSKIQRRHRILERLRRGPIASQEELVAELAAAGEVVTQATVSRDLRAIGAVKGADGYVVPEALGAAPRAARDELGRAVRERVVDLALADSIVVIRTMPGHANAVATVFDDARPAGLVGTVAGDDTIFLACTSRAAARALLTKLRRAHHAPDGS